MYVEMAQVPVFGIAKLPLISVPKIDITDGGGGLTETQKKVCETIKKQYANALPWLSAPECGICPEAPAVAECPACEPIVVEKTTGTGGFRWWWLLVAAAGGLATGGVAGYMAGKKKAVAL